MTNNFNIGMETVCLVVLAVVVLVGLAVGGIRKSAPKKDVAKPFARSLLHPCPYEVPQRLESSKFTPAPCSTPVECLRASLGTGSPRRDNFECVQWLLALQWRDAVISHTLSPYEVYSLRPVEMWVRASGVDAVEVRYMGRALTKSVLDSRYDDLRGELVGVYPLSRGAISLSQSADGGYTDLRLLSQLEAQLAFAGVKYQRHGAPGYSSGHFMPSTPTRPARVIFGGNDVKVPVDVSMIQIMALLRDPTAPREAQQCADVLQMLPYTWDVIVGLHETEDGHTAKLVMRCMQTNSCCCVYFAGIRPPDRRFITCVFYSV